MLRRSWKFLCDLETKGTHRPHSRLSALAPCPLTQVIAGTISIVNAYPLATFSHPGVKYKYPLYRGTK